MHIVYIYTGGVICTNIRENRIVEAYVGEYASGKSELSINRAIELKMAGHQITIVDLDVVEPFYTLRPIKKTLQAEGLNVISFSREDSFGLGETGAMLNPKARWALMNEGDIILDIGYGVHGAKTLNLVEGAEESKELKVLAVINQSRPITASVPRIKEYVLELERVDAIVCNTHLGDETTVDTIIQGNELIMQAAQDLAIPVEYIAVEEKFKHEFSRFQFSIPVKFIKRYMPNAIW